MSPLFHRGTDETTLLRQSGAIVDALVALDLRREPTIGEPAPNHAAVFEKMQPLLLELEQYGVYGIPRLAGTLADAPDERTRKAVFRILSALDEDAQGIRLMVEGCKHGHSLVRHYSQYGASLILMSLKEESLTAVASTLSMSERNVIISALQSLAQDPKEHSRLREITHATLQRAQQHGFT